MEKKLNGLKQKIREAKNISRRNKDKPEIIKLANLVIRKLEKLWQNLVDRRQ